LCATSGGAVVASTFPEFTLLYSSARRWSAALLVAGLTLAGCSPTFNWRALQPEGTPLEALMPCKPETAVRSAPLVAGSSADLHMFSCETGGLRFALAWADVGDVAKVPAALASWRGASLASIRVAAGPGDNEPPAWPVAVSGVSGVLGVKAEGQDPQGQPVQTRAAYFARGSLVFQAAIYGARLPDEPVETFFSGLRLPPA
jgi:hypothetical protein